MTGNKLNLTIALLCVAIALLIAAISTPPAIGKADSLVPKMHRVPSEASACGVV